MKNILRSIGCRIITSYFHQKFMPCKGICDKYKAQKPARTNERYDYGQKRCNMCGMFIEWEGVRCPCCSSVLRTRNRNTRHRLKLMQQVKRI